MLKKVSLLLLSLFVLMFAVSCGGEKEAVKSEEAVSIDVWLTPQWKGVFSATEAGADFDSFLKKAAEEFKKENPNVTVNVQVIPGDQISDKLSVAIQTKTMPDVFF